MNIQGQPIKMSTGKKNLILKQLGKQNLNQYTKLATQGRGNYGHVYMAQQKQTKKKVAIKKVKKIENQDEGICVAFIRQISIMRKLNHPNIVKLLDYSVSSEKDGYFILEFLPIDLQKEIKKGKIDLAKTRNIIKKILQAVSYCHKNYIIHRDIKPSNILINPDTNQIKLADFGIAKQVHLNPKCNTTQISALNYRAPELLLKNQAAATYSIDLWGIGCVFGECILGRILFQASAISQVVQLQTILKILQINQSPYGQTLSKLSEKLKNTEQKPIQNSFFKLKQDIPQSGLDLLNKLLCFNPEKRITAEQALAHPFFNEQTLNIIAPKSPQQKYQTVSSMSDIIENN